MGLESSLYVIIHELNISSLQMYFVFVFVFVFVSVCFI